LLLDQSVIAGIGNIYRAEILFLSRIHPSRPGKDMTFEEFDHVWNLSVKLLELGVKHNRIVTRKAAVGRGGRSASRVPRADRFNVYKVEHCLECGQPISRWTLANRMMYSCSQCQE
jgi:endonuclease-8